MAENDLASIAECLGHSISPQYAKESEQQLKSMESQEGFSVNLLHVVASSNLPGEIRLAGALFFKNLIKRKWMNEEGQYLLPVGDIEQVKVQILDIMIKLPSQLQLQIGEAISLIAESDFPHNWPTLIDSLKSKLSMDDFVLNKAILSVAHSIFKRWRPLFRSDELFLEIKLVLDKFAEPFLALLNQVHHLTTNALNKGDKASSIIYLDNLLSLTQIYYDFNCQDIPEFFEDNMNNGMSIMHLYLSLESLIITDPNEDEEVDILIKCKTAIVELVSLYVSRYADVFGPLIENFIMTVWHSLNSYVTKQPKFDLLVVKYLTFLTSVTKISDYQHLFNNETSLKEIIEKTILPNTYFREVDEESFEDEPINYVRSDLEGSDFETRRKSATEFLKELKEVNMGLLTDIVMGYVEKLLSSSSRDWRNKDLAIYLFSSLAAKGNVTHSGVTSTNVLVDIVKFFVENISGDLTSESLTNPILKTNAIKYILTFRNQLTKEQLLTTIPLLVTHLRDPNPVVYTYSSITIEKLLSMNDFSDVSHTSVFLNYDIKPYSDDLLNNLFTLILVSEKTPEKLAENEFLMKCVMRVLNTLEDSVDETLNFTVNDQLLKILKIIARNPSNPRFTQYTFESIALLIRFGSKTPQNIQTYMDLNVPVLLEILSEDVQEFAPYIFQILAYMLELYPSGKPLLDTYAQIVKPLLSPAVWEYRGNIPGIVRLLVAIINYDSSIFTNSDQSLLPLLGVFQKLISSRANDAYGFDLLEAILVNIQLEVLKNYLNQIATLLLTRLKNSRTEKFVKRFVIFLCSMCCVPLNDTLNEKTRGLLNKNFVIFLIDSVQNGVFGQIFNTFVLTVSTTLANLQDKKIVLLGILELINAQAFTSGDYSKFTVPAVETLVRIIDSYAGIQEKKNVARGSQSGEDMISGINELDLESASFGSQFSKIVSIQKKLFDPLPLIKSNDENTIKTAVIRNIGRLGNLGIFDRLSPEVQQSLRSK